MLEPQASTEEGISMHLLLMPDQLYHRHQLREENQVIIIALTEEVMDKARMEILPIRVIVPTTAGISEMAIIPIADMEMVLPTTTPIQIAAMDKAIKTTGIRA
jgi:hypothetical protein